MSNHLEQIEEALRELIAQNDAEALVAWVKERVLESYRNGMAARRRTGTGRASGTRGGSHPFARARSGISK